MQHVHQNTQATAILQYAPNNMLSAELLVASMTQLLRVLAKLAESVSRLLLYQT